MPLVFENLSDLKQYIEEYLTVTPIFYQRDDLYFAIMAGKASWKGEVKDEDEANKLEAWLKERGAVRVKGWEEIEEFFERR